MQNKPTLIYHAFQPYAASNDPFNLTKYVSILHEIILKSDLNLFLIVLG